MESVNTGIVSSGSSENTSWLQKKSRRLTLCLEVYWANLALCWGRMKSSNVLQGEWERNLLWVLGMEVDQYWWGCQGTGFWGSHIRRLLPSWDQRVTIWRTEIARLQVFN